MVPWRSRSTFVLALAAAAVGLSNVWRFAYLLGENGGAPFMLAYVVALLVLAVPVMVAEVTVGSLGRGAPATSLARVAAESGLSRAWGLAGLLACGAALLLLVAIAVIGAWSLAYAFHHQLGSFAAISLRGTQTFFEGLLMQPLRVVGWLTLALAPLLAAAIAGVHRGVALLMWLCVPLLIVLFYVLIGFSLEHGDLDAAGRFLFQRQWLDFGSASFLLAFTHALFTLGVGIAVGLTFGAYAPDRLPLVRSVLAVALFDVVLAVAVAVAVFPLLFANNVAPSQGPGLLFIALPYAFGNLGFGDFFGTLFFFAVYVVSLASAVALLEPLLVTLQRFGVRRARAAIAMVGTVWGLALASLYSLVPGSAVFGLFVHMESLVARVLLPLSALLLAVFVGWRVKPSTLRAALSREPDILFSLWYFLLRFVVPPALLFAWLGVEITAR